MTVSLTAFCVSFRCRPESIVQGMHAEGLRFEASMPFRRDLAEGLYRADQETFRPQRERLVLAWMFLSSPRGCSPPTAQPATLALLSS